MATLLTLNDDSFGTEEDIRDHSYAYDAELPLSVNGTVAYKVGTGEADPVIKLQFNSTIQRWQVIGVKITKWTTENEPFAVYFLATTDEVKDKLENMNLESIIVDNIDTIFVEERPNMVATIKALFTETIEPLINERLETIPTTIEELMKGEIDSLIEEKIEAVLDESYAELITQKVEETIPKFHFGRIEPYHKEKQLPKWVGTIYHDCPLIGHRTDGHFTRRINTNGIEEYWMGLNEKRINECSNSDELTQMFNNIEPYKSMGRMEISLIDLKNIEGDSIYSKTMYERLMSQSLDRNNKTWNGQYYHGDTTEIANRQTAWFVPLKKCHFVDVSFTFDGLSAKEEFLLRAVGEEEFTINLKDYFPHATNFVFRYYKNEACGHPDYVTTSDGKITSRVHPAFLTKYDTSLLLMGDFVELDYVYMGAFLATKFNTTDDTRGLNTAGFRLLSKPFLSVYTKQLQFPQQYQQYLYHVYGNNPSIGVNMRPMSVEYAHLVDLLQYIESAYEIYPNNINKNDDGFKWTSWNLEDNADVNNHPTGMTWKLGNLSGKVYNTTTKFLSVNYRGIENFKLSQFYQYIYNHHKKGATRLWHAYPHTSRKMPTLFATDADYKDTGYDIKQGDISSLAERGTLGLFRESKSGNYFENNYVGNSDSNRVLLYFGRFPSGCLSRRSIWNGSSHVGAPHASRSNI